MSTIEVKVPDIGDFTDIPVIEIFVKPGDSVKAEDSLVTLESDKATMDVPSPAAGTVKEVKVKLGDKVSEGSPIVVVETSAARARGGRAKPAAAPAAPRRACRHRAPAAAAAPPAAAPPPQRPPPAPKPQHRAAAAPVDDAAFKAAHASPSVRKFARELGVDLARVTGSAAEGPHPAGGRPEIREAGDERRRAAPRRSSRRHQRRRLAQSAAVADGRLREIRSGRSRGRCRGSRRFPARTSRGTG